MRHCQSSVTTRQHFQGHNHDFGPNNQSGEALHLSLQKKMRQLQHEGLLPSLDKKEGQKEWQSLKGATESLMLKMKESEMQNQHSVVWSYHSHMPQQSGQKMWTNC